jgi:hypothetical protein
MKHVIFIGLGLVSLTTAASAQDAPVAAAPVAAPAKPKVICRTEDTIGSRLETHKECHTAEEWRQISRAGSDFANSMTRTKWGVGAGQ